MEQRWDVLNRTCPSRKSLARIASKWTALVIIALGERPRRFGELRTRVQGISAKVLAETLRDLERDGMLTRHVFAQAPSRVEYELTPLGESLHEPLSALVRWAESHTEQVQANRDRYDAETDPGVGADAGPADAVQ